MKFVELYTAANIRESIEIDVNNWAYQLYEYAPCWYSIDLEGVFDAIESDYRYYMAEYIREQLEDMPELEVCEGMEGIQVCFENTDTPLDEINSLIDVYVRERLTPEMYAWEQVVPNFSLDEFVTPDDCSLDEFLAACC